MLPGRRSALPINAANSVRALTALLLIFGAACRSATATGERQNDTTLRIGFGLNSDDNPEVGIRQVARLISLEGLVVVGDDGRPLPRLAESWNQSPDGLTWRVTLRPGLTFHSGKPMTAQAVRQILKEQLPAAMGPAFEDVADIRAISDREVEFRLVQPSRFLVERLDGITVEEPGLALSGAGPFHVNAERANEIEMTRNDRYHAGMPTVPRIAIKPYTSVRGAWADMLRGQVDVLYEVGVEALDSLESSRDVRIYRFQRGYAYLLLLNVKRPFLKDPATRRALNAAINRDALITDALRGHAVPATGPVSPQNWAYAADLPRFDYRPKSIGGVPGKSAFKVVFDEPALERMALVIQRQLQAVGVDIELQLIPPGQVPSRLRTGDFDAALADYRQGPNLARPYLYWHSGAPLNYGGYSSARVDAALDSIRHGADDTVYKAGVAAFQRAIVDDPPAVFLAWSERARAVSTRFDVPADVGDILRTVHRWRPTGRELVARRNQE